jgi:hypothetical protein
MKSRSITLAINVLNQLLLFNYISCLLMFIIRAGIFVLFRSFANCINLFIFHLTFKSIKYNLITIVKIIGVIVINIIVIFKKNV